MIKTTDKPQAVKVRKATLSDYAVWKHGARHDIRVVRAENVVDALWDAFGVLGMIIEGRFRKASMVYKPNKTFLVDLGGVEWVVKKLTPLECDTTYKDCKVYA